jgi:hypothetical protein
MADEPFDSHFQKPDSPRPPRGERVWVLHNGNRKLTCELRDDGAAGYHAQVFLNGDQYAVYRLATRAAALAYAAVVRQRFEQQGWTDVAGSP